MPWRIRRIVNCCAAQQLVARQDVIAPEFISYGLVIRAINRKVCLKLLGQLAAANGYHETGVQTPKAAGGKAFLVQAFRLAAPNHRLQAAPVSGRA